MGAWPKNKGSPITHAFRPDYFFHCSILGFQGPSLGKLHVVKQLHSLCDGDVCAIMQTCGAQAKLCAPFSAMPFTLAAAMRKKLRFAV